MDTEHPGRRWRAGERARIHPGAHHMKEMDEMSEFDPTAITRALDPLFLRAKSTPQLGFGDPGPHLNGLVSGGQLTQPEADALRGLMAKGHGPDRIPAATAVKEIDAILSNGTVHGPVALAILKVIQFVAETEAAQQQAGTQHENFISVPNVDWGSASDGAVEGAGWGGTIGVAIGVAVGALAGPVGVAVGAVVGGLSLGYQGAILGGAAKGLGHGASGT
jgi:hypothetical protein